MTFDPNQFSGSDDGSDDLNGSSGPPENPPPIEDLFESILENRHAYATRDNYRFLSIGLGFYEKLNKVR